MRSNILSDIWTIWSKPRSQPSIVTRELPGQAMAAWRGSCRGRALRSSHSNTLLLVSSKLSHVPMYPYPRRPSAYEKPLPAPITINCRKPRSKWAVRFCRTIITTLWHIVPLVRNDVWGKSRHPLSQPSAHEHKALGLQHTCGQGDGEGVILGGGAGGGDDGILLWGGAGGAGGKVGLR